MDSYYWSYLAKTTTLLINRFPLLFLNRPFLLLSESLIRTAANEIKIPVVLSLKSNPDLCRIPERFYFSTNMIETSEVVIFFGLNSEIVLREHFIFVFLFD